MPIKHFTEWTLEDAQAALSDPLEDAVTADGLESNRAFVEEGDHWQDGETWVGPRGSDALWASTIKSQVLRQFTPVDLIGEVLDRIRDALVKREPSVELAPASGEEGGGEGQEADERRDEVIRALSEWWDSKRLWPLVGEAIKRGRWATRASLRFWVPPGRRDESGSLPSGLTLSEALDRLELTAPDPEFGGVYVDEETREEAAIFIFTDDENRTTAELWWAGNPEKRPGEIEGATHFRLLGDTGEGDVSDLVIEGTFGALPIAALEASLLITEAVRRQQNRLNFFESLLNRVAETGGFPERYTLNAKAVGIWQKIAPPSTERVLDVYRDPATDETWYLWPSPVTIGAGVLTNLVGIDRGGEEGGHETPNVQFRDPTDPQFAIKAAEHARASLLSQCKQGHLVNTSRAEASGLAYEQARADHVNDLEGTRIEVESMLRRFLESALAWAAVMSAEAAGILDTYRVVVTFHVNAGPLSAEQKRAIADQWKDGLKSRDTALSELGVEDVMAELDQLAEEERSGVDLRVKQAAIVSQLLAVGVPGETAALFAGFDPEDEEDAELIAALQSSGFPRAVA